jgi:orotate phosphoribosyltransferase
MDDFQREFAELLANAPGNPLFFGDNLVLRSGRSTTFFVNIGSFSETAKGIWMLGTYFGGMIEKVMQRGIPVDMVAGPSYKASAIAQAAVNWLYLQRGIDLGFCYDRKEAKRHGEGSGAETMFVGARFHDGSNVCVVDDVATSMGTKLEFIRKIRETASDLELKVNVNAVVIGVDREEVGPVYREGFDPAVHDKTDWIVPGGRGKDVIDEFVNAEGIPCFSVLGIRDCMRHLCEVGSEVSFRKPDRSFERVKVTEAFLDKYFHPYVAQYGVQR